MTSIQLETPASPETAQATPVRRAPFRLRDLDRGGLMVAALLVVLIALPWAASFRRATDVGFQLSNDDALIGLRVRDVFNGNPPLIGQPSTAAHYSENNPSHPGPIEFYLLTAPTKLFGTDKGALIGAGLFSLGAVLTAVWAVFRRAGPIVGVTGALVFSGIAWAEGPLVLTDIISSNVGGIPLLGLAVLGWAVFDGDIRLLPLGAFFFSFVAQQHLAILGMGVGAGLWLLVGAIRYWLRWRWHEADAGATAGAAAGRHWTRWRWSSRLAGVIDRDDAPEDRPRPWLLGAVGVIFVAWLPVIIDAVAHGGGNIKRIASFGGDSRETLGLLVGLRQPLRALAFPPLLFSTNHTGGEIMAPLSVFTLITGLLVLAALVAIVVGAWRRRPALAGLALTALVIGALGAINGSQIPDSIEALRINFYRWAFVVAALAWLSLIWAAGELLVARSSAFARLPRRPLTVGAVGAVAVISLLACTASGPRARRDTQVFGLERTMAATVEPAVEGKKRLLMIPRGTSSILAMTPGPLAEPRGSGPRHLHPGRPGPGLRRASGDR